MIAGSTLGLLIASWSMRFLVGLLSADMLAHMPYLQDVGINGRIATFAGSVALAATLVFTFVPMLRG